MVGVCKRGPALGVPYLYQLQNARRAIYYIMPSSSPGLLFFIAVCISRSRLIPSRGCHSRISPYTFRDFTTLHFFPSPFVEFHIQINLSTFTSKAGFTSITTVPSLFTVRLDIIKPLSTDAAICSALHRLYQLID